MLIRIQLTQATTILDSALLSLQVVQAMELQVGLRPTPLTKPRENQKLSGLLLVLTQVLRDMLSIKARSKALPDAMKNAVIDREAQFLFAR